MSVLRKPAPIISPLLPPHLEALKQLFRAELNQQKQLLSKILRNIHTTVEKMHADPEQMWQQIDFQAEAIDQVIRRLCKKVRLALEEKCPPDTTEEEEGINFLVLQLEWDLSQTYCVEDHVEKFLDRLSKQGPQGLSPLELLPAVGLATEHPGKPLPTGSWWQDLDSESGADQGCYLLKNYSHGIKISSVAASSSLVVGAQEIPEYLPTVTSYDDFCATLHCQNGNAALTTPLLRASPYITFLYRNSTPLIQIVGATIGKIQAFSASLVPNQDLLEGQVFSFEAGKETYLIFSSMPITLQHTPENGLKALSFYEEVIVRVALLPQQDALPILLQHAWVYATAGSFQITKEGEWTYTYASEQINPLAHLQSQSKKQDLLIALLPPDWAALSGVRPQLDLFYATHHGPARLTLVSDDRLHFAQRVEAIEWPDAAIAHKSQEDLQELVKSFVLLARDFDLKFRGTLTLPAADEIHSVAKSSHAMYTLLRQDLELIDNSLFMAAFHSALCIAKAGLNDYFSGGFLQYDAENKKIITVLTGEQPLVYGHLIAASAYIRDITPDWFHGRRAHIVDLLIQDICCPYDQSPYFPKLRMWDPYTGLGTSSSSIAEELDTLNAIALWARGNRHQNLESYAMTLAARLHSAGAAYHLSMAPSSSEQEPTASLLFWLEKAKQWLYSCQPNSHTHALAHILCEEIQFLIQSEGCIQDLHIWARSIQLPSLRNTYPSITYNEIYPFCVITQTDPQEAQWEIPYQQSAPDTQLFSHASEPKKPPVEAAIEPEPLFSTHSTFSLIKSEITSYLSERSLHLYQAQSLLSLEQQVPSTDAMWRKLLSTAQFRLQQLQSDIASCKSPTHWNALGAKWNFRGSLPQIQKQTAHALKILCDLFSAQLAIGHFTQALAKINMLEMADATLADLSLWAQQCNTSGLTAQDLGVWKTMEMP